MFADTMNKDASKDLMDCAPSYFDPTTMKSIVQITDSLRATWPEAFEEKVPFNKPPKTDSCEPIVVQTSYGSSSERFGGATRRPREYSDSFGLFQSNDAKRVVDEMNVGYSKDWMNLYPDTAESLVGGRGSKADNAQIANKIEKFETQFVSFEYIDSEAKQDYEVLREPYKIQTVVPMRCVQNIETRASNSWRYDESERVETDTEDEIPTPEDSSGMAPDSYSEIPKAASASSGILTDPGGGLYQSKYVVPSQLRIKSGMDYLDCEERVSSNSDEGTEEDDVAVLPQQQQPTSLKLPSHGASSILLYNDSIRDANTRQFDEELAVDSDTEYSSVDERRIRSSEETLANFTSLGNRGAASQGDTGLRYGRNRMLHTAEQPVASRGPNFAAEYLKLGGRTLSSAITTTASSGVDGRLLFSPLSGKTSSFGAHNDAEVCSLKEDKKTSAGKTSSLTSTLRNDKSSVLSTESSIRARAYPMRGDTLELETDKELNELRQEFNGMVSILNILVYKYIQFIQLELV